MEDNNIKLKEVLNLIDKDSEIEKSINFIFNSESYKSKPLVSANLSRLLNHIKSGNPFGTISGFKQLDNYYEINSKKYKEQENKNYQTNLNNNKNLAIDIRNNGLGFIQLKGFWKGITDQGIEYEYEENSFFVIGKDINYKDFKKTMIDLQLIYEQDSVIIGIFNDNKLDIEMTDKDGYIVTIFNGISILSEQQVVELLEKFKERGFAGYSKLKGHENRKFLFSGIYNYKPQSLAHASLGHAKIYDNAFGL